MKGEIDKKKNCYPWHESPRKYDAMKLKGETEEKNQKTVPGIAQKIRCSEVDKEKQRRKNRNP